MKQHTLSVSCSVGVLVTTFGLLILVGSSAPLVHALQPRTASEQVYTEEQARRGQATYVELCARCHGATLQGESGPPLTGEAFVANWQSQPVSDLVDKIKNELSADADALKPITWPASNQQSATTGSTGAQPSSMPALGNMAQLMRGILFPASNLIFNAQSHDPSAPKPAYDPGKGGFSWVDWGAGIYSGWELVDYAAVAIADAAPLLLTPRRCENGKPAPVERADWIKYTRELADAGRAAYKASQSRSQDAVIEVTNQLAEACLNCHRVYRDKRSGTSNDPSNKAARCVP
jgi:mono/diheme cytochrome c family protein